MDQDLVRQRATALSRRNRLVGSAGLTVGSIVRIENRGQVPYLQLLYCHLRLSTKANTSALNSSECCFMVVLTGFLALVMVNLYSEGYSLNKVSICPGYGH
jgi:hypothetical protein